MRFLLKSIWFSALCALILMSDIKMSMAQNVAPESSVKENQAVSQGRNPRLIHRFEFPVSSGPSWDILRRATYGLKKEDLQTVAVRICSEQNLLLSIPSAVNNPFEIVEGFFKEKFSDKNNLPAFLFLRAEDCGGSKAANMYAVEVWAMRKDSPLPPHVESYRYEQVKMLSLGFDPAKCSTAKTDSVKAAQNLIKRMRADNNSYGIIIGYRFDEKTNPKLRKGMEQAENLMKKSGLPKARYAVSYQLWHADDSPCSGKPIEKPSVIFITKME
jgi:hypothetical protein